MNMPRKQLFPWVATAITILLLLASCTDDDAKPGSTLFNLRMTDAPMAQVQQVNIDLQTIIVTTDSTRDSTVLGTNAGIYNLLDYQGDLDTLIGSAIIQAFTVDQIRLVLGDNNSVMVDSVLYDLKTPSAQQSGLKINLHADISTVDVYNVLIDFDAEKSVVEQGNGGYLLKPVIKVVK
jgi:hypothetical protein